MFKITIEETRLVKKVVGKNWDVVANKEEARDEQFLGKSEPRTRIVEIRGYTPEIEKEVEQIRTVLNQEVEDLDIAAVIKAINKL